MLHKNLLCAVCSIFLLFVIPLCHTGCKSSILLTDMEKTTIRGVKKAELKYLSNNWEIRLSAARDASIIAFKLSVTKVKSSRKLRRQKIRIERLLLKALDDSHSHIRIEALCGLAYINTDRVFKKLQDICKNENDSNLKWYALRALAKLQRQDSLEIFINGLKSNDWLIREASIKGLLLLPDIQDKDRIIPYITRALKDKKKTIQLTTLRYLKLKDKRLYRIIRQKLLQKNIESRNMLLQSILLAINGYMLDEKSKEKIIDLLGHRNTTVRILALRVLKKDQELRDKAATD